MDKTDKTLGRREFMVAVGGAVVVAGCGDAAEATAPAPASSGTTPPASAAAGGPAPSVSAPVTPPTPAAAGSAAPQLAAAPPVATPPAAAPPAAPAAPPAAASSSPVTGGAPASPATAGAAGAGAKPAAMSGKARIYVIKASDRKAGIEQALSMFGGMSFARGRDVVLKPNFNSQYAFPATTHDDTIRTVVGALKAANAGKITLGESSGATTGSATPTATVLQMKNSASLCKDLGIELLSYDDPGVEWESFTFDGITWSGGLAIPKLMRSDRVKILMPCCKTHTLGDFTCSIKLAAGLPQRNRRGLISDMHTNLQEKVADINKGFTPDLIVMDATKCFIDGGPDSGTTADPGLIVVGNDRIALDAVGVAILKYAGSVSAPLSGKIFATRQLARAVKIGLSSTKSPDDIELVGNDDAVLSKLRSILDMG
jgi:uncharacterized protein (DUF362 family)